MKIKELSQKKLASLLPFQAADANKYTRGKLVALGGSKNYPGAICLASLAALRMGAGYVEVLCAPETLPTIHAYDPNVVARSWEGWSAAAAKLTQSEAHHPQACLIGSGFDTQDSSSDMLLYDVLYNAECPVIIDGGAITAFAKAHGRKLAKDRFDRGLATITTPHFGEAKRLATPAGITVPESGQASAEELATFAAQIARVYGATVMLKGPKTYIASPASQTVFTMTHGTAALAKAGTGDVLAGMTSSLICQGLEPVNACNLASWLHS